MSIRTTKVNKKKRSQNETKHRAQTAMASGAIEKKQKKNNQNKKKQPQGVEAADQRRNNHVTVRHISYSDC